MPIYEETYTSWQGQRVSRSITWVIARTGIRLLWNKGMVILILFSAIPFFVRAVQIYLITRFAEGTQFTGILKGLVIDPEFFFEFLKGQGFFLLLIMILSGSGLIANDRKFRALPIYFSKPVGFWDYVTGKWLIVAFYGSLVTLVPGLILFLMKALLSRDSTFIKTYFWMPFSIMGIMLVALVVLGGLMLCLSAASRGSRPAGIVFFGLLIFPDFLRLILSKIPEMGLFSLNAILQQFGSVLFGIPRPFGFPLWAGAMVLAGVVVLSILVLRVRVNPTDVVK